MKPREAAQDLLGREVSLSYNPALGTVTIEFGRAYEDDDEAEFMGDALPVGAPNGYVFTGATLFSSSNADSTCVGLVELASSDERKFDVTISGFLGAAVSFQFDTLSQTRATYK